MGQFHFMLLHHLIIQIWHFRDLKYEELKDDMENNENLMKVIKDIYVKYTSIPKKELDKISIQIDR